jgi:hypothetical protein
MIKTVSFCNLSDVKIINSDLSYKSKTKLDDGQIPENLLLSQLIFLFFNHPDNFYKSINTELIHYNNKNIMIMFNKMMYHIDTNGVYSLYKYNFKIYKTKTDISKLLQLYKKLNEI